MQGEDYHGLNPEQRKLVEAEPNGYVLIRGVAGSGKTTVALHRTLFLLRNYCSEDNDRVLLATFNRTLINYLRKILGRLKEKDYYRNIFSGDDKAVAVKTVDSLINGYNPDTGKELKFPGNNMKLSLLKECIVDLRKRVEHPLLDHKNDSFLLNEIEWIKSCNYMELEEYQNVDRIGRQSVETEESPQRLPKNSPAVKLY
jgi:superfamily I DNA/RNA helicase